MGINGLSDFIKKKHPGVFKDINMNDMRYKKIAVDTSLYLYKYKVIGGDLWMDSFIRLICCLRKFDVHPIFIFDTSAPIEKIEEQKRRRQEVQKRRDNVSVIEELIEKYHSEGVIDDELQAFYNKKIKKKIDNSLLKRFWQKDDLGEEKTFDIKIVEDEIEKIKGQNITITPECISKLKNLFELLGVPYYQALEEAEQTCSYLCHWGLVDGVLTEDSDVLAYGVDLFISKINTFNGYCTLVETPNLLEKLEFTKPQLLDFCIMLQCDYNTRMPGVGPVGSYKLLKEYGCLEKIEESGDVDVTPLKYKRCRELFSIIDNQGFFKFGYCSFPKYKELGKFLYEINSQIPLSNIKKDCSPNNII